MFAFIVIVNYWFLILNQRLQDQNAYLHHKINLDPLIKLWTRNVVSFDFVDENVQSSGKHCWHFTQENLCSQASEKHDTHETHSHESRTSV